MPYLKILKLKSGQCKEVIIKHTNTNSDLFENFITEYREVAKATDGHEIDAERLIERRPSE